MLRDSRFVVLRSRYIASLENEKAPMFAASTTPPRLVSDPPTHLLQVARSFFIVGPFRQYDAEILFKFYL